MKRFSALNGYIFEARIYAMDSWKGSSPIPQNYLVIWHRLQGGSWTSSSMTDVGNYWYQFDLSRYPSGSWVEVQIQASANTIRDGYTYHDGYKYGWAPPYIYRPTGPESNASKAYLVQVVY